MVNYDYKANDTDEGAITLVVHLTKAFEKGTVGCGMHVFNALWFSAENSSGTFVCFLEHQRRVLFDGCVSDSLHTITATLLVCGFCKLCCEMRWNVCSKYVAS